MSAIQNTLLHADVPQIDKLLATMTVTVGYCGSYQLKCLDGSIALSTAIETLHKRAQTDEIQPTQALYERLTDFKWQADLLFENLNCLHRLIIRIIQCIAALFCIVRIHSMLEAIKTKIQPSTDDATPMIDGEGAQSRALTVPQLAKQEPVTLAAPNKISYEELQLLREQITIDVTSWTFPIDITISSTGLVKRFNLRQVLRFLSEHSYKQFKLPVESVEQRKAITELVESFMHNEEKMRRKGTEFRTPYTITCDPPLLDVLNAEVYQWLYPMGISETTEEQEKRCHQLFAKNFGRVEPGILQNLQDLLGGRRFYPYLAENFGMIVDTKKNAIKPEWERFITNVSYYHYLAEELLKSTNPEYFWIFISFLKSKVNLFMVHDKLKMEPLFETAFLIKRRDQKFVYELLQFLLEYSAEDQLYWADTFFIFDTDEQFSEFIQHTLSKKRTHSDKVDFFNQVIVQPGLKNKRLTLLFQIANQHKINWKSSSLPSVDLRKEVYQMIQKPLSASAFISTMHAKSSKFTYKALITQYVRMSEPTTVVKLLQGLFDLLKSKINDTTDEKTHIEGAISEVYAAVLSQHRSSIRLCSATHLLDAVLDMCADYLYNIPETTKKLPLFENLKTLILKRLNVIHQREMGPILSFISRSEFPDTNFELLIDRRPESEMEYSIRRSILSDPSMIVRLPLQKVLERVAQNEKISFLRDLLIEFINQIETASHALESIATGTNYRFPSGVDALIHEYYHPFNTKVINNIKSHLPSRYDIKKLLSAEELKAIMTKIWDETKFLRISSEEEEEAN